MITVQQDLEVELQFERVTTEILHTGERKVADRCGRVAAVGPDHFVGRTSLDHGNSPGLDALDPGIFADQLVGNHSDRRTYGFSAPGISR